MYLDFLGLRERPFSITADPSFLYLSKKHREALSHMVYGIRERKGFVEITGEIGTGKTTLCKALLRHLEPTTKTAPLRPTPPARGKSKPPSTHPWRTLMWAASKKHGDNFTGQLT